MVSHSWGAHKGAIHQNYFTPFFQVVYKNIADAVKPSQCCTGPYSTFGRLNWVERVA